MKHIAHFTPDPRHGETPLDAAANGIWADAYGMKHLLRTSSQSDVEANKPLLVEVANIILSYFEARQWQAG